MADDTQRAQGASVVEERLALRALEYGIPAVANRWPYWLGGLTFVSALIAIVTGLVLAQFYQPSPLGAHDSVVYIVTRVPFGDFLRNLHVWSATAMTVTLVAHLCVVFVRRSYVRPREVTWWAGVGMAGVVFFLIVTGTVLRYDQEGFEALAHLLAGAQMAGILGLPFQEDLTASTPVLARVFQWHTSLFPILLLGLAGLHFWLIRHHGIHSEDPKTAVFRTHLRRLTGAGLLLFTALGLLAVLFPEDLGYPPVAGVEVTKPFWALLWVYGLENLLGLTAMVLGPSLIVSFLIAVPLLDRGRNPSNRIRRAVSAVGLVLLIGALGLGLYAALAPAQQHLGM
jgi:ubiquinol-cytochrome c reductase cytochrome b subunit